MSAPKYPPSVDIKREMLTKAREQYRQIGYACEMDLLALEVQDASEDGLSGQQAQLEVKRDNAYAAARRMDDELKKIPAPKPEKAK